jgi:UDP-glucose 4-epimerase
MNTAFFDADMSDDARRGGVDRLGGRRVLVGGASGFLGSNLCHRLLAAGAEVHAVSRRREAAEGSSDIQWWQCELVDAIAVQDLIGRVKPDVVFHLGGMVTADPSLEMVAPTFHSLLGSTVNVLTAMTRAKCGRVVLVGSLEEPTGDSVDALTPSSPYAAAKLAVGAYARMFVRLYQTPVVVVRAFMTYGPGQKPTKIIPYTIMSLLRREAPRLSKGQRALDWVYVDDVVDGFLRAAAHPGIDGRTLELGSGTATSIQDVVMRLVRLIDPSVTPRYGIEPDRPDDRIRVADVEATENAIGWSPRTPLDEGLARTVAWYRRRLSIGGGS